MLKISRTAEYLQSIGAGQEDDLVVLIDGYDVHFQLPVEVLVDRYYRVIEESNARLKRSLGRAYYQETIREQILFAAEKGRWPNPCNHISSWTLPTSTGPEDAYYNDTDTVVGWTEASSCRPRYLNGGFVIGTMSSMRKLYNQTQERIMKNEIKLYAQDSDQGVMATMMGQQNYMREVYRLKHISFLERLLHPFTATKPRSNQLVNLYVDNILSPSFTHDKFEPEPGKDYEFGIGLDYMMDFTHQTSHSEVGKDTNWITFKNFGSDIEEILKKRQEFECQVRVSPELPEEIKRYTPPPLIKPVSKISSSDSKAEIVLREWEDIPLYTHLCFGTIPVMVHHNGDKDTREWSWKKMWIQPNAQQLLGVKQARNDYPAYGVQDWNEFKKNPGLKRAGGAWTDSGEWLEWSDLCPSAWHSAIY